MIITIIMAAMRTGITTLTTRIITATTFTTRVVTHPQSCMAIRLCWVIGTSTIRFSASHSNRISSFAMKIPSRFSSLFCRG